jgi:hypothetical protein
MTAKTVRRLRYSGQHVQFRSSIDVDAGPLYEALLAMKPGARAREYGAWARAGFGLCRGGALLALASPPTMTAPSTSGQPIHRHEQDALEAFAYVAPPRTN